MKKIIVMGGSYNPPTKAHLLLMQTALDVTGATAGLFVPVSDAYLKRKLKNDTTRRVFFPYESRAKLLNAMCGEDARTAVCEADKGNPVSSFYALLCDLQPVYPEATLYYTIRENPYFVKAGAVIPMASPAIGSLQERSNELYLFVAPGAGESEAKVYEDDGATQAYKSEYALTTIRKSSDARSLRLQVGAREGRYAGMAPDRRVRVVLEGIFCPKAVRVNGTELAYSRFAAHEQAGWGYDGNTLAATLYLPASAAGTALDIEVEYGDGDVAVLNGKKGLIGRALEVQAEGGSAP